MGWFDGWVNAWFYSTAIKKKRPLKYYDTDEEQFLESIPEGQAFVFLTTDRKVHPFKDGLNGTDMIRGAIQGVSKSKWIHAGVGYKKSGEVKIIESLEQITLRRINDYFTPETQLKLYFPPLSSKESKTIWEKALTKEGQEYDYGEILDHVSVVTKLLGWFGFSWGKKGLFICSSFARWAFKPFYDIISPAIKEQKGKPADIHRWMNPKLDTLAIVYNIDPKEYS